MHLELPEPHAVLPESIADRPFPHAHRKDTYGSYFLPFPPQSRS
jgi:hypothetical protein